MPSENTSAPRTPEPQQTGSREPEPDPATVAIRDIQARRRVEGKSEYIDDPDVLALWASAIVSNK